MRHNQVALYFAFYESLGLTDSGAGFPSGGTGGKFGRFPGTVEEKSGYLQFFRQIFGMSPDQPICLPWLSPNAGRFSPAVQWSNSWIAVRQIDFETHGQPAAKASATMTMGVYCRSLSLFLPIGSTYISGSALGLSSLSVWFATPIPPCILYLTCMLTWS